MNICRWVFAGKDKQILFKFELEDMNGQLHPINIYKVSIYFLDNPMTPSASYFLKRA